MTLLGWVLIFIIAAIVGGVGQALAGYSSGGCLVSAVVGIVGAFIGQYLAGLLGLPLLLTINVQGYDFPIIWSVVGSALFVAVLGLITGRRR